MIASVLGFASLDGELISDFIIMTRIKSKRWAESSLGRGLEKGSLRERWPGKAVLKMSNSADRELEPNGLIIDESRYLLRLGDGFYT